MVSKDDFYSLDEYFVISAMRESDTPLVVGNTEARCFEYPDPDSTSNKLLELRALSVSKGQELGLLEAFDCMRILDKLGATFFNKDDEMGWYLFEEIAEFGYLTPAEVIKQQGELGYDALRGYIGRKVTQEEP
ncbi:MAG: hypothetical protein GYB20_01810 [Oceanospirillales bacterium]|nr:hypothetical protein [Oceanospirillales bacterium]MBR9886426.1 hypothetical protein [Oceanospirillales bacterium]